MEVQLAEEAWGGVGAVFVFEAGHVIGRRVGGKESDIFTVSAGVDAS